MDQALLTSFGAAMLAIVNPIGKIPLWYELTGDETTEVRRHIAAWGTLLGSLLLLFFLLVGSGLLHALQLDVASFRVAGGALVFVTALRMVQGHTASFEAEHDKDDAPMARARARFERIIVPFAIPILAGPGSITTVVVFGARAATWLERGAMALVLLFVFVVDFLVLRTSPYFEPKIPSTGFTIATRLFGLILAGIAVQLMAEGLAEMFPAWTAGGPSSLDDDAAENG